VSRNSPAVSGADSLAKGAAVLLLTLRLLVSLLSSLQCHFHLFSSEKAKVNIPRGSPITHPLFQRRQPQAAQANLRHTTLEIEHTSTIDHTSSWYTSIRSVRSTIATFIYRDPFPLLFSRRRDGGVKMSVLGFLVRSIPSSVGAGVAPPAELDTGASTAAATKDDKMAGGFVAFAKVSTCRFLSRSRQQMPRARTLG
jgi:hypothetical protein